MPTVKRNVDSGQCKEECTVHHLPSVYAVSSNIHKWKHFTAHMHAGTVQSENGLHFYHVGETIVYFTGRKELLRKNKRRQCFVLFFFSKRLLHRQASISLCQVMS